MKLKEYLTENKITITSFARHINVSRDLIYRWLDGRTIPRYTNILKIQKLTKGQVKGKDFLNSVPKNSRLD